jgi:hypothetical protein
VTFSTVIFELTAPPTISVRGGPGETDFIAVTATADF